MRIKKIYQTSQLAAQVVNTNINSTKDTYSCDYVNNNFQKQMNIVTGGDAVKVGYKIDGKDVYIKRYNLPSLSTGTAVAHGLTNFEIIDYNVMTYASNAYRKMNYSNNANYYVIDVTSTSIILYNNGTLSGTGKISLYYILTD